MDVSTLLREEESLQRVGLLVERCADGSVRANVAHVRFHSPTGFECGYAGSGPADLALSVLHALMPPPDEADEERQYELSEQDFEAALDDPARWSECIGVDRVRVSRLAYSLHQICGRDGLRRVIVATASTGQPTERATEHQVSHHLDSALQ